MIAELVIRQSIPEDVAYLGHTYSMLMHRYLNEDDLKLPETIKNVNLLLLLGAQTGKIRIATIDEMIAGSIVRLPDDTFVGIHVKQPIRNQGIGRALLESVGVIDKTEELTFRIGGYGLEFLSNPIRIV